MLDFFTNLFDTSDFPARWRCGNWSPGLGGLHIVSDLLIWLAYVAIPVVLVLLTRRKVPYPRLFWLFGAFIFACGTTHLIEAVIFYEPVYRLAGVVKGVTAVVSWATVLALFRVVPQALAMKTPGQLEGVVASRTAELKAAVDDLKRTEAALRESQRQFRELAEGLPQLVWTDRPDGYCDYLSPQWVRYTGIPEADQLGYGWADQVHPDDRPRATAAWDRAVAAGTDYEVEFRIRRADGVYRWFQTRGVPLRDESGAVVKWFGTNTDVEDYKRTEAALRESEARFHRTFDHMLEGCQIIGFDWRYLYVNDSVVAHAGRTRDDLVGRTMMEVYPGIEGTELFAVLRRCMADRTAHRVENRFEFPDGHAAWFDLSVQPGPEGIFVLSADITDRKRAEAAVRATEGQLVAADRRLAKLVQGMSEACFIVDADWRFTFANDRCAGLLHHRRDEMLGRPLWEVFHQLVGTPMEGHYRQAMAGRASVSFVAFSPVAGRWLDIRLFPTGDGLAAFLLDIHDRKLAEEALHRSEAKAGAVLSALAEGVVFLNPGGDIEMANAAVPQVLGRDLADLTGPGGRLFRADGTPLPAEERPAGRALRTGRGVRNVEVGVPQADDSIRWLSVNAEPVRDPAGTLLGAVSSFFDITERKLAEENVRRSHAESEDRVRERTAELEAANKELEAFSYSVSHDLRAPLRAIDGFSRIVVRDYAAALPAEARDYLADVRRNAQRMGRLVDDLLAFSRLGRKPLRAEEVDMTALVRQCLAEAGPPPGADVRVADLPAGRADPALLKQVWLNLLANAFKYAGKRETVVVEVGARAGPTYYVRDNGVGFDMRYAPKLFGVFQRLHKAEDYEGTGIGLALVQRIVHRHGGRIWAEAEPDRGATFFFTLSPDTHHD